MTRRGAATRRFDVAVIGAGQAGVPLAIALGKKGHRVALAERKHLGGSCVNFGCTPTKAVIASARVAHLARRGGEFGIRIRSVAPDFVAVLERARGLVMQSRMGLRDALAHAKNVTALEGHARFEGRRGRAFRLSVGDEALEADRVVINVGTRSRMPKLPGLAGAEPMTAENWLGRRELPASLVVLGAGYTGLEMAQFYRRMGSRVTMVEAGPRIASAEDEDVSNALQAVLEAEDVGILLDTRVGRIRRERDGLRIDLSTKRRRHTLRASNLFVATGRRANTDDLGLETIGLETAKDGTIRVDRRLSTPVRGVWVAGDARGGPMFTHAAWDDHRVLISQLAGDGSRTTDRIVPYAIYTDPQLGRVGATEAEARRSKRRIKVGRFELRQNGKARELGETEGFVKVVAEAGSGRILGAAVLSSEGAELVHLFVDVLNAGARASVIRDAIHVHPTLAEAVQSAVAALE